MAEVVLKLFFVLSLLVSATGAHADEMDEKNQLLNEQATKRIYALLKKNRDFDGLLKSMKGAFTPDEELAFRQTAASMPGIKVPEVSLQGSNGILLTTGKSTVLVEIISAREGIFAVNRKQINFKDYPDLRQRAKAVQDSLPRFQSFNMTPPGSPLLRIFVQRSEAILPLLFAGATMAAPYVVGAATLGGTAVGAYLYAESNCNDLADAADSCKKPKREMERLIALLEKQKKEAKAARKKEPTCPHFDDDDDKDDRIETQDNAIEALDSVKRQLKTFIRRAGADAICSDDKTRAEKCQTELRELAQKSCVDLDNKSSASSGGSTKTGGK